MEYIIASCILVFDQLLKAYVNRNIPLGASKELIPGILSLTNVHNFGAAWGSLSGYRVFLIIITVVCVGALLYVYRMLRAKLPARGRIILLLIAAGSVGNLIDRAVFGYVRDMLEVLFIDFPIFNIADCAITVGAVLLVVDTLFFDRDSVLTLLEAKLKKGRKEGQ